jgi:hypothetical protein
LSSRVSTVNNGSGGRRKKEVSCLCGGPPLVPLVSGGNTTRDKSPGAIITGKRRWEPLPHFSQLVVPTGTNGGPATPPILGHIDKRLLIPTLKLNRAYISLRL